MINHIQHHRIFRKLLVIIIFIIVCSCNRIDTGAALEQTGSNAKEIEAFINNYDDGRKEMAKWLVASMPGHYGTTGAGLDSIEQLYRQLPRDGSWWITNEELEHCKKFFAMSMHQIQDLKSVTACYLIDNLDDSYRLWKGRTWNTGLPPEQFCELLLPYRIGDEQISSWRKPYRKWLSGLEDTLSILNNSVEAARIVASFIGSCPYNDRLSTPHRTAINLLEAPVGYCREDCDRTVYAMRAMGIPVTIDMMPVSPDNGSSHQWNVVYDNADLIFRMFDNAKYLPTRDSLHYDQRRKGKVLRYTFAPDMRRIKKYAGYIGLPATMLNPWLKDVTAEYFGHNQAEVSITSGDADVVLGIFAGVKGIQPVDIAEMDEAKAIFRDIEPEVIFFPVAHRDSGWESCGYPFMINADGSTHIFKPDIQNPVIVSLTRKMPMRFHNKNRLRSVVGITIATSNSPVGPWRNIHTIQSVPAYNYYRIPLPEPLRERFVRLRNDNENPGLIAEIIASRDSLGIDTIPLSSLGESYRTMTDRNILTSIQLKPGAEDAIFQMDTDEPIPCLFLVPANDDNHVLPMQEYELLYADQSGWKSLGRKMAQDFHIEFSAPRNAVFILKNLTRGVEEQVFIYSDGQQLFNLDLRGTTRTE